MTLPTPIDVQYPEGHTTYTMGRNGVLQTHGVTISAAGGAVRLTPIRANGLLGNAFLELASDPATLLQVAHVLLQIAAQLPAPSALPNGRIP